MSANMAEETKRYRKLLARLTQREERQAIKSVRTHLADEMGVGAESHIRILSVELRINKPQQPSESPQRLIGVVVADYANRRNLDFSVDADGNVVQAEDLHGAQPPFTRDEIADAREIAERDERVARLANTRGSFVSVFGPEKGGEDGARVIGLRYAVLGEDNRARLLARVGVNLSDGSIAFFQEGPGDRPRRR